MDEEELFADLEESISTGPVKLLVTWDDEEELMQVEQLSGLPMSDARIIGILELAKLYTAGPFVNGFIEATTVDEEEED